MKPWAFLSAAALPAVFALLAGSAAAAQTDNDKRVDALVDKLPSPCGAAHSLKKSLDVGCKRAPFAKKYIERLVQKYGASDDDINQLYRLRYTPTATPQTFDLKDTPYDGNPKAPVVLVEFFDYGCPHCREAVAQMEELLLRHPRDIVVYYKHFPLSGHKDSVPAARAAVAAARQGRFRAMHKALFAAQGNQSKEAILKIAQDLKLDQAKFEKDWNDPTVADKVNADRAEGEKAQLPGTPAIYINGRYYAVPVVLVDELDDWVAEELAQNR